MEKQVHKLEESTLNKIKENQAKAGDLSFEVGQLHFRIKDLQKEIQKLNDIVASNEIEFDKLNTEISDILVQLNEKYPNGELDLNEGVIYY
jgi:chromosome segregation ATPase